MSAIKLGDVSLAKKGNEGVWFTLKHPITEEPLANEDGKTADVKVLCIDSEPVKQMYRDAEREKVADPSKVISSVDALTALAKTVLVDIRGVDFEEGVPLASQDNWRDLLLNACSDYVNQIAEFSADRERFLGE